MEAILIVIVSFALTYFSDGTNSEKRTKFIINFFTISLTYFCLRYFKIF